MIKKWFLHNRPVLIRRYKIINILTKLAKLRNNTWDQDLVSELENELREYI